jgi:hypothetical protein
MTTLGVCLVSHTNAGKTTLARTLLRRDVGEVGDRAHVTQVAESHVVVATGGDALVLWDTPGFGDSVRLLRRLRGADRPLADPLGWFLSTVWDRYADRPFWCGQQAMRSARDAADMVLYVANAAEDPASTAWVAPELEILAWLGKPVLVLLNQLGGAHDAAALADDLARWRAATASNPIVRDVLPFDAFARCWVQEHVLLDAIAPLVPASSGDAFVRLRDAWRERDLQTFDASLHVLARQLATLAADREVLADAGLGQKARAMVGRVVDRVAGRGERDPAEAAAEAALAARLDTQVRDSTDALVRLHGLAGRASGEILQKLGRDVDVRRAVDPGSATLVGGLVSGAVGGLAADLAAGGLTLGAGALIGGVLGALGARGAAQAYNVARGAERGDVRWSGEFLDGRAVAAIVRYLAVAHFGRGRGDYVDGTVPSAWVAAARTAVEARRTAFGDAWRLGEGGAPIDAVAQVLERPVREALVAALVELHPSARAVLESRSDASRR